MVAYQTQHFNKNVQNVLTCYQNVVLWRCVTDISDKERREKLYTVEQARRLRKISAEEMATKLGMSRATYSLKEKGKRRFFYDEAVKFAVVVDMPLGDIIFS